MIHSFLGTLGRRFWNRTSLAPALCTGILLAVNLAFFTKAAPTLRLVELSVCREHYLKHDAGVIDSRGYVPEELCKLDSVQRKVAWLFTLDELLHFCCGKSVYDGAQLLFHNEMAESGSARA